MVKRLFVATLVAIGPLLASAQNLITGLQMFALAMP